MYSARIMHHYAHNKCHPGHSSFCSFSTQGDILCLQHLPAYNSTVHRYVVFLASILATVSEQTMMMMMMMTICAALVCPACNSMLTVLKKKKKNLSHLCTVSTNLIF